MSDTLKAFQVPLHELDAPAHQLHFESILNSVPDAMVVTDETGTMLAFSRAAEHLFGYTASEMIGQPVNLLMAGRDRTNHGNYIGNYLHNSSLRIDALPSLYLSPAPIAGPSTGRPLTPVLIPSNCQEGDVHK